MNYIDEKFKEVSPISTVERIISILGQLGIELQEIWNDSGLDNCWSLVVAAKGLFPSSNGKGLTKELARASAYGEFMERLQSGLFLYKYQSIQRDPDTNLHSFAPDGKYMTLQFHAFLRPEKKFDSLEALRAEIRKNADQTRTYFSAQGENGKNL